MKGFYIDNYNRITLIFWGGFIFLLWLQYVHLSTFVEASLFMIVLIPGVYLSYLLANRILPKAIHTKKMKAFTVRFFAATFFVAFSLAVSYQLIRWAEVKGYFPHSVLLADDNSLITDFLFAIPSTLLVNFGSCGLRFYYENIKLQQVNLETQLQMLQSQINPHFMFNVLNHIHVLMQINVELASDLLLQYADMLRFQLYKGKCERVSLKDEVVFLKNFIGIEKLRWGEKVKVDCHWNVIDYQQEIPPLLLIPFIENAFKYASRTVGKPGFVRIGFWQERGRLSLEVRNSKSKVDAHRDRDSSGIGLENTRKRLDLLFSDHYRLTIENEEEIYYLKLEVWQI